MPDFSTGELTTSTVMLADRLTVLPSGRRRAELSERPYVIGSREIQPAADAVFRPSEELIVVFLVYNPAVTPDKHFDLEVEYHFFRKSRAGEEGPRPGAPAGVARCRASGISTGPSPSASIPRSWGRSSTRRPGSR